MGQFQKGNPGGPGRPKGSSRNAKCLKWAEEFGVNRLLEIASGRMEVKPELQFEALKLALAYGIGKPTESVDLTNAGGSFGNPMAGLTESQLKKLADANESK